MPCYNCGQQLASGDRFCTGCGAPVEAAQSAQSLTCPSCRSTAAPGAAFCATCGTPLHAGPAPLPKPPGVAQGNAPGWNQAQPPQNTPPNWNQAQPPQGTAPGWNTGTYPPPSPYPPQTPYGVPPVQQQGSGMPGWEKIALGGLGGFMLGEMLSGGDRDDRDGGWGGDDDGGLLGDLF